MGGKMFSLLTNSSISTGLRAQNLVNKEITEATQAVSTGQKVRGPLDDPSNFAISQGLRGELRAIDAVIQGLNNAKGVVKVGLAGAEATSDIMSDIRKTIIQASNPGITAAQRNILNNDYNNTLQQMRNILETSEFNGHNTLIERAIPFNTFLGQVQDLDVLSNTRGDNFRINGHRLDVVYARLINEDLNDVAGANAALDVWEANIGFIDSALGDLGADARQLKFHTDNLMLLRDEVASGLGNIVDADMARAAANLTAAQVKQKLSTETLNISMSQPKIIQQLFPK